jgi:hypothetical protein
MTTNDDYQMVVKMVVNLWRCQPPNLPHLAGALRSHRVEKRTKLFVGGNSSRWFD